MYRITADNSPLWSPHYDRKKLVSPKLSLKTNTIGSLSFTILPDHESYNSLVKMQSIITVHQDSEIVFKGRIFSDKADFRKAKKVEVEGLLGYFNDSIVRPYSYTGSVRGYVQFLIDQHNAQQPEDKQFKLGNVTVTDPNDTIVRSSTLYPKTWDEISEKLFNSTLGGYIVIRYELDGNYIDYLKDFTSVSSQKIEYAVNLLDLDNEVKADNLATCIVPLGASLQNEDGSSYRVTIESVNNGLDYVFDPLAEEVYKGRISKTVIWDDVTEPSNLLTKANAYLATAILLEGTLTIKAVDLHLSDDQIESFRIGQYIPVYSIPHGIDERMLLNSYDLDLSDPSSFSFSLGRTKASFVDTQMTNNKTSERAVRASNEIGNVTEKIQQIEQEVNNKVNVNQGTGATGDYLGIGEDGNVIPMAPPEEFRIHDLPAKTSIAEGDEFPVYGVNVSEHRKITWTTIKSTLKTYFGTLYAALSHTHKVNEISDFPDLGGYAGASHTHKVADISDFPNLAESYATKYHTHDVYAAAVHSHEIAGIIGLEDRLKTIEDKVKAIEDSLSSSKSDSGSEGTEGGV